MLLTLANGAPVIAQKLLGNSLAWPVDGGCKFFDHRPVFGPSKTVRGLIVSIFIATASAPALQLPWYVGGLVGTTAMLGDLLSSFLKRRLSLAPSTRAIGIDQIPESFLPLLACQPILALGVMDIVVGTAAFSVGGLILSRLLFQLNIRDRPF